MPSSASRAAGLLLAPVLLLGGCSGEEPPDDDRLVLTPPSAGAGHTHAPGTSDAAPVGDGTTAAAGGYRLAGVRLDARPGAPGEVRFRVVDRSGDPVTEYVEEQTKLLHLYVVRADHGDFRHLHPTLAGDGTWSAQVDLASGGPHRVVAEFTPAGSERPVALGVTRVVRGTTGATGTVPAAATGVVTAEAEGPGAVGDDGRLTILVGRTDGGGAVALGGYLGATAHLTGFREGDGGFVHVHPYGAPEQTADGTRLTFHTAFAEADDYRMFLQVRVDGFLHTVSLSVRVER